MNLKPSYTVTELMVMISDADAYHLQTIIQVLQDESGRYENHQLRTLTEAVTERRVQLQDEKWHLPKELLQLFKAKPVDKVFGFSKLNNARVYKVDSALHPGAYLSECNSLGENIIEKEGKAAIIIERTFNSDYLFCYVTLEFFQDMKLPPKEFLMAIGI
jgi:hypothetical protein